MLGEKQTVKQAIENKVRFDRVSFVDKKYEGKTWMSPSYHPTIEELLNDYGDNICQQMIVHDNEGFDKYSLVIWVDSTDPHLEDNFFKAF